jgi:uncharacterized protein (TIGR03086 family)
MSSPPASSPPEPAGPSHPPLDGAALLERAVGYTRGSLQLVATTDLDACTPCAEWTLLDLLRHMNDSLAAFTEAAAIGYVDLVPVRSGETGRLLVDRLRSRACAVLEAWAHHPGDGPVAVADRELRPDLLAAAGALEIAVHGWDVAQACGVDRPLPAALALDLLDVVPALVARADRPGRFADPVAVPLHARASTRLLAAPGR